MGQISSNLNSKKKKFDEEIEYSSEEDEGFDSIAQTPYDENDSEEDESSFEDCNEDVSEEYDEEDGNQRKRGSFQEDYSDEGSNEDEELLQEEINKIVQMREQQTNAPAFAEITQFSPDQSNLKEIRGITDDEVYSIIQDIMDGKSDNSIDSIWHTVENSHFSVNEFGLTYFLPVFILSKKICLYFQNGGTQLSAVSSDMTLLQNYISEWITMNQEDTQMSFVRSHAEPIQYLYSVITSIQSLLTQLDESEQANRITWILEYIDRMKSNTPKKARSSRSNSEISLIAMLSPESDPGFNSPARSGISEADSEWTVVGKREFHRSSSGRNHWNNRGWNQRGVSPIHGNRRQKNVAHYRQHSNQSRGSRWSEEPSESMSQSSSYSHVRELHKWQSEEGVRADKEWTLEEFQSSQEMEGNWDQFVVNKEKFGIEAGFNESLYTVPMSSLPMNEQEWKEVVDAAKEMELEDDNGRSRISSEIRDGEEDSVLYSDVRINRENISNTMDNNHDSFIDSNIRK